MGRIFLFMMVARAFGSWCNQEKVSHTNANCVQLIVLLFAQFMEKQ